MGCLQILGICSCTSFYLQISRRTVTSIIVEAFKRQTSPGGSGPNTLHNRFEPNLLELTQPYLGGTSSQKTGTSPLPPPLAVYSSTTVFICNDPDLILRSRSKFAYGLSHRQIPGPSFWLAKVTYIFPLHQQMYFDMI